MAERARLESVQQDFSKNGLIKNGLNTGGDFWDPQILLQPELIKLKNMILGSRNEEM